MPDDIGAHLREARERAGITLRDVAAATKISVPALAALERNDIARLPGGIFVRAFVRAYARQVGLDPEDAVRRFVARFPDAAVEDSPARHESNPEAVVVDDAKRAGGVWRVVVWVLPLVLAVVFFMFGGRLSWWGDQTPPAGARGDEPHEPVPPGPAAPILSTPAPTQASEPPVAAAAPVPDQAVPPAVPAQNAAPAPAAVVDQQAAPAQEGRFQLTLTARGLGWVTIRCNGAILFTGTMNPGDRKDFDVWGRVSLTVGNAGVMDVAINGQPARPLGGEGEVVTTLMNVQNLKTFLQAR